MSIITFFLSPNEVLITADWLYFIIPHNAHHEIDIIFSYHTGGQAEN